jgi:5-methylcytosine-specific restriction protein A
MRRRNRDKGQRDVGQGPHPAGFPSTAGRMMPRAPKKCTHPECETRVIGKARCPEHPVIKWKSGGQSRTSTAEHRAWRKFVLDRDHWWCKIKGPTCTGRAKQADHKVPVAIAPHLEYDVENGQAACDPCHARKTAMEGVSARKGGTTTPPAPSRYPR